MWTATSDPTWPLDAPRALLARPHLPFMLRLAGRIRGRRGGRPARRCGRPGRGKPARRRRSHTARRGGGRAGAAGGASDDGGGLELCHSLSSVRRRGLKLRVSRAMAELARAGRHFPRPSTGGHAGRAQVVAEERGPPMAGLAKAEEQGPTPDGAGPSLPTPSPSPTAAYRRSRGPAELSSAPRPSSSAAVTASCAGLRPHPFSGAPSSDHARCGAVPPSLAPSAARIVGAVGEPQPRRGQRAARRGPEWLPELWLHRADPRWWPRL